MRVDNEYFIADFPSEPEVEETTGEAAGMKLRTLSYVGEAPESGTYTVRLRFIDDQDVVHRVRTQLRSREVLVDQFATMLIDEVANGLEPRFSQDAHVPSGSGALRRFLFEFDFEGEAFACAGEVILREKCIVEQFAVTTLDRENVESALRFMQSVEHKRSII